MPSTAGQGAHTSTQAPPILQTGDVYAKQKERALQFIYDDEVRCSSRFVNDDAMLRWAPL